VEAVAPTVADSCRPPGGQVAEAAIEQSVGWQRGAQQGRVGLPGCAVRDSKRHADAGVLEHEAKAIFRIGELRSRRVQGHFLLIEQQDDQPGRGRSLEQKRPQGQGEQADRGRLVRPQFGEEAQVGEAVEGEGGEEYGRQHRSEPARPARGAGEDDGRGSEHPGLGAAQDSAMRRPGKRRREEEGAATCEEDAKHSGAPAAPASARARRALSRGRSRTPGRPRR
jgi:hypothetical protein